MSSKYTCNSLKLKKGKDEAETIKDCAEFPKKTTALLLSAQDKFRKWFKSSPENSLNI